MKSMTRNIKYLLFTLILFSNPLKAMDSQDFKKIAVQNIYKVIPRDRNTFTLMKTEIKKIKNPVIYSNDENTFQEINCINSVRFNVLALGNDMASIGLSACPYSILGRDKMTEMKDGFNKQLLLMTTYRKLDGKQLENAGLVFTKNTLDDGAELFYFPVIFISHGIGVVKTLVLYPSDSSYVFVLQLNTRILCESIKNHALCDLKHEAAIKLLVNVMNEFILKNES